MSEKSLIITGVLGISILSIILVFLMLKHEYAKPKSNLIKEAKIETYQNQRIEIKTGK